MIDITQYISKLDILKEYMDAKIEGNLPYKTHILWYMGEWPAFQIQEPTFEEYYNQKINHDRL